MLAVASASMPAVKYAVYSVKDVTTKNSDTTSHVAQNRFLNNPNAAMMLVMPINATWGGNPLIAMKTKSRMPATPKKAVVAILPRLSI